MAVVVLVAVGLPMEESKRSECSTINHGPQCIVMLFHFTFYYVDFYEQNLFMTFECNAGTCQCIHCSMHKTTAIDRVRERVNVLMRSCVVRTVERRKSKVQRYYDEKAREIIIQSIAFNGHVICNK